MGLAVSVRLPQTVTSWMPRFRTRVSITYRDFLPRPSLARTRRLSACKHSHSRRSRRREAACGSTCLRISSGPLWLKVGNREAVELNSVARPRYERYMSSDPEGVENPRFEFDPFRVGYEGDSDRRRCHRLSQFVRCANMARHLGKAHQTLRVEKFSSLRRCGASNIRRG